MKKQRNQSLTEKGTVKFMQVLGKITWKQLTILSSKKEITVQEYLRAIVIPNHLESLPISIKKYSKRAKKAWATRRRKKALYGTEKVTEISPTPKEPWETDKRPDL